MKKLMIAAAIVCAAALSHGAALNWGMNSIPNGATDIAPVTCFWIAADSMNDFNAAADKWEYVSGIATADKAEGGVTSGRNGYSAKGTFGDFAIGDAIKGFIVAFDDGHVNYVASDFADFQAPSAGSPNYAASFITQSTGWLPNSGSPEPVPEPTSGLLLLIGVAGMALRRRRV